MNYFKIIFLILLSPALRAEEVLCAKKIAYNDVHKYSFLIPKNICLDVSDCWVQFLSPEDQYKIDYDGVNIGGVFGGEKYSAHNSIINEIKIKDYAAELVIIAKDINQNDISPNKLCINIGPYKFARSKSIVSWFFKTGSSLFSAYFLLIISSLLVVTFLITRSKLGLSLFMYSLVSSIYLVSFSEYPREFFDSVILSGAIHFPLRLLQDVLLIRVFKHLCKDTNFHKLVSRITTVYLMVIFSLVMMLIVGIESYQYFLGIMFIMAPLVAAPMAVGTWCSFHIKSRFERNILIPTFLLLFLFQINDLFVFWRLYEGYFTVKLYIPLIVSIVLFIFLRRLYAATLIEKLAAENNLKIMSFIHDIKSPLSVLTDFFNSAKFGSDPSMRASRFAKNRIIGMIDNLSAPFNSNLANKHVYLNGLISMILSEKRVEYPLATIRFIQVDHHFTICDPVKLQIILSNIINNSVEACSSAGVIPRILINLNSNSDGILITLTDNGPGVSQEIKDKVFSENFSTKSDKRGLGLYSAARYIKDLEGKIWISNRAINGFELCIKIENVVLCSRSYLRDLKNNTVTIIDHESQKLYTDNQYFSDCTIDMRGCVNLSSAMASLLLRKSKNSGRFKITGDQMQMYEFSLLDKNIQDSFIWCIQDLPKESMIKHKLILIDDDPFVQRTWELSSNENISLHIYSCPEDFLKDLDFFDRNVPIYCDLYYHGVSKSDQIHEIINHGFSQIYLCTSASATLIDTRLKDLVRVSKLPPPFAIGADSSRHLPHQNPYS